MTYSELLNLLNKSQKNYFYISSKNENQTAKALADSKNQVSPKLNNSYFHFDFGNNQEEKISDLKKKIKLMKQKNTTKFVQPKVSLVKKLIKRNDKSRENSKKEHTGFYDFLNYYSGSKAMDETLSVYFPVKKSNNFMENILKMNKMIKEKKNVCSGSKSKEPSFSNKKMYSENSNPNALNGSFDFYQHLRNKKMDHMRIFSARAFTKRETVLSVDSPQKKSSGSFQFKKLNDGNFSGRDCHREKNFFSKIRGNSAKILKTN